MNPYAAPGTQPRDAEEDIAASSPPLLARVAGGGIALAGAVVALTGAQTLAMVSIRGPFAVAPWVLLALGVGEIVLGGVVFRARAWGAVLAVGVSLGQVLAAGTWLFFSASHGLISLYALAGPFVSLAAVALSVIAMGPCQKASAARARLKAQGMDLGILRNDRDQDQDHDQDREGSKDARVRPSRPWVLGVDPWRTWIRVVERLPIGNP